MKGYVSGPTIVLPLEVRIENGRIILALATDKGQPEEKDNLTHFRLLSEKLQQAGVKHAVLGRNHPETGRNVPDSVIIEVKSGNTEYRVTR